MPWYWTDEIARALLAQGRIDQETANRMASVPVAVRRDETTMEAAADAIAEDDDVPLAA